tara:strand:- start:1461 stop:1850 length:390 start_codon:yes stop_codon:yes gene_type:complete
MYEPEVDDYVIWTTDLGMKHEGWVYFKCDDTDNEYRTKFNWRPVARYITIELGTKPKPHCEYTKIDRNHKLIHVLLLCYDTEWKNLRFVKKRKNKNDDTIIRWAEDSESKEKLMVDMYKSQEGRYGDPQ